MEETWRVTPVWRESLVSALAERFPEWTVTGEPYLSWVWVDTHDAAATERMVASCKAAGVPIRSGAPGYNLPTFIRLAVRKPEPTAILLDALSAGFKQA